jgi:glutamate-ammonia-ligase adenylyltransferase
VKTRDPAKLARDVAEMRERMAREHTAKQPWDIKHWRGGLVDIEFIAQYLQLRHAREHPEMLTTNTAQALDRAAAAAILPADAGHDLRLALDISQTVQGLIRLTLAGDFDPAEAPEGLKRALARAAGAVDFGDLEATLRARTARAHELFKTLIEQGT